MWVKDEEKDECGAKLVVLCKLSMNGLMSESRNGMGWDEEIGGWRRYQEWDRWVCGLFVMTFIDTFIIAPSLLHTKYKKHVNEGYIVSHKHIINNYKNINNKNFSWNLSWLHVISFCLKNYIKLPGLCLMECKCNDNMNFEEYNYNDNINSRSKCNDNTKFKGRLCNF